MLRFLAPFRAMSSAVMNSPAPLEKVVEYLENFAPKSLAEDWDNTGLLLEPQTKTPIKSILLTNDLTENVVQEAIHLPVQLIISYHPPIFRPLKKITTASWKERVVGSCLENRIALYSPHTAWDSVRNGVNDWLLSPFVGLMTPSEPILRSSDPSVQTGAGRITTLKTGLRINDALKLFRSTLEIPQVRVAFARSASAETLVHRIAVCAGSGASVLSKTSADLFITGEMSHHEILDANHQGSTVFLCNHSDSERGYLKHFAERMSSVFPNLNIQISTEDKDPICA